MRHALNCVSWTAALAAALVTAVMGSWHGISVPLLAARCLLAGLLVLVFLRGVGELAWRTVLRSLAEYQLRQEEERRERRRREKQEQLARLADSDDPALESPRAGQGREDRFTKDGKTGEAGLGKAASTDRNAA